MGRVVVIGSTNVDLTIVTSALPAPGQTVLGHTFVIGPGGKGSNQAIAAMRLGADVTFVTKLGNDRFGDQARTVLRREGLLGPGVLRAETHTGVALIMVDDAGRNAIAVAPGANALLSREDLDAVPGLFDGATHLLCQLECPVETFIAAARPARAAGVTIVLDPAPIARLTADVLGLVDILTPNETELARLTGMRATHDDDRTVTAARALLGRGVGRVIVTLGERGALSVGPEGSTRVPPFPVETRDPTGAGDAFAAAVVVGLASDLPLAGALRLGTRAGAFCAKRLGVLDGLPTVEALDREVPDPPA